LARRSLAILLLASVSARVVFVARLRSAWPGARVAFVSIKPSPARRAYIEVFTPMLDSAGQPRPELFVADSLHMTRAGYLLWRALLAPVVH
jgi:hypothetical protein